MTEHIKVETSFVKSLLEGAAWDAARVSLVEKKSTKKEMKETHAKEEEDLDPSDTKKESVEVHECPLCESVLEEELSDEVIFEHIAQIQEALKTLEEKRGGDEDEPTDADLKAIEDEEPDESKSSKKEAVMKKVKELKASAKGK